MKMRDAQTVSLRGGRHAVIAPATEHDAAALLAYLDDVGDESDFLTFGRGGPGLTLEQEATFVRDLRELENGVMLRASIDGEIAGVATLLRPRPARVRHMAQLGLSVRKKYWGLGLGRVLAEELILDARQLGLTRVELRVRHDNARAVSLYEALGFRLEGRLSGAFKVGDVEYDDLLMALRLHEDSAST
jgi:RimJ/RimL family protein N-acetyltransferase